MASLTTLAAWFVAVTLLVIAPNPKAAADARAAATTDASAAIRKVAQIHHIPEADLTFSGRPTEDGGFVVEARGGELIFQKKSLPGGLVQGVALVPQLNCVSFWKFCPSSS